VMLAKRGVSNVQFRLGLSVPQSYLIPMLLAPSTQVYDLAVLGTVLDMDIQSIPELNHIRELAEKADEVELPPITVDSIRARMHEFVAFDTYLKFGRDWPAPDTPVKTWGNMAAKAVVLAEKPISGLYSVAQSFAKIPTISEIKEKTRVIGNVAVVEAEAPRGGAFNYSKLAQAAFDAPIVVTRSVGFQPGKKVIVAAPNAFEKSTEPYAAEAIKKAVYEAYNEFKEKGWSDEQDFPRGTGALTLGVKELYIADAVVELVDRLNQRYDEVDKARYAARLARGEMLALVADERLAASFARLIENIIRLHSR